MRGLVGLVLAAIWVASADAVGWDVTTPLDDYVNRPDPFYRYEVLDVMEGQGFSVHVLNMTSQKWFDESWTEKPVWWHHLHVIIPDQIKLFDAAMIRIYESGFGYEVPGIEDFWFQLYGAFSIRTGAVSAILMQDPNQPMVFTEDPLQLPRVEDFIIAHTWRRYIESEEEFPDKEMILQMPMVKAGKHAIDTIAEYVHSINPESNIDKYLPTGASKRGWVTWLLGCVDQRVFGIAPLVFDMLNFLDGLHHHNRAMGGWSWAFTPYWSEPVTRYVHHPRTEEIAEVIDPMYYNERLTMPKLNVIATCDEFFLPTDSHMYWDDLNGAPNNFMNIIENADHSHDSDHTRVLEATEPFFMAAYKQEKMPTLSWERIESDTHGSIILTTDTEPTLIQGWVGDTTNVTENRRDFRQVVMGRIPGTFLDNPIEFVESPVEELGNGQYRIEFPVREEGYRGFFMNACFAAPEDQEFCFSSEFHVIPDVLPYPECVTPQECQGVLV